MSKMAENMDWEKDAPQLAGLKKSTPFSVPPQYFEGLTERINQAVFINNIAIEKTIDAGFSTPKNYFETLQDQLVSRIALEELKKEHQGFTVPDHYFETLSKNISAKTINTRKTAKLWHRPIFKYGAAACLAIVATTGWYINSSYQTKKANNIELAKEQLLYDIDENVIIEYINENKNAKTASLSDSEMEDYILDNFSTSDLSNNL